MPLPTVNADGRPVVEMSDEQKYLFDIKGWLLLPGLLSDVDVAAVRDHFYRLKDDPESLPIEERHFYGGPAQILLDPPELVSVLDGAPIVTVGETVSF